MSISTDAENLIYPNYSEVVGVDKEIGVFLRKGFDEICHSERHAENLRSVPRPWPPDEVVRILETRSGGDKVYASTVLRYVNARGFSCLNRLQCVLEMSDSGHPNSSEIDKLYDLVLSSCPDTSLLLRILGVMIIRLERHVSPIEIDETPETLEAIFDLTQGRIQQVLAGLSSVLRIPQRLQDGISSAITIDPSFVEFLTDPHRSGKHWINRGQVHKDMIRGIADFIRLFTIKEHSADMKTSQGLIFWSFLERLVTLNLVSSWDETIFYIQESATGWQPCILSSTNWSKGNQVALACMLSLSKGLFQGLHPTPSSLVRQFTKHINLVFQVHLSPESIAAIQAVLIFVKEEVYPGRYRNKFMELSGFPEESGYHLDPHFMYAMSLLDPQRHCVDHFGELGPLKVVGKDLWDFLSDPGRCGDLYHDRALSYARIADCWLGYLEGIWTAPSECHNVILSHWSRILSHSTPGDQSVMQRLRQFRLAVAANADVDRVLHWLKRAPETPKDVLSRWQIYNSKKWDSSTKPKGLFSGWREKLASRRSIG